MKKVLAICGSTRERSSNLQLIEAIKASYETQLEINLSANIGTLPQFNPDDLGEPGEAVSLFRQQINNADGVLICTPEYAMGVPGALKNAIDWTVSTCEFSNKPVALITASTLGEKGHRALLNTLEVIEADIAELLISYIQTKVKQGQVTDEATNEQIMALMDSFMNKMNAHDS
ncbi:MAG: NAD(P)H-dependent oxidoreductase [Sphingobacteriales bacterium]|nr:MAG: NAD(P)H-dependent oxidoreductase [Sphingobacteriales bacterium]